MCVCGSDDWGGVSDDAKQVIRRLLDVDPAQRWTATQALGCEWVKGDGVAEVDLGRVAEMLKQFNGKRQGRTFGAPPHRAPSPRCTADLVHRVWRRQEEAQGGGRRRDEERDGGGVHGEPQGASGGKSCCSGRRRGRGGRVVVLS